MVAQQGGWRCHHLVARESGQEDLVVRDQPMPSLDEEERGLALSDPAPAEQQDADAMDLDHHPMPLLARSEQAIERLMHRHDGARRSRLRDQQGSRGLLRRGDQLGRRRGAARDDDAAHPQPAEPVHALLTQLRLERLEEADLRLAEDLHARGYDPVGMSGEHQPRLLDPRVIDDAIEPSLAGHEGRDALDPLVLHQVARRDECRGRKNAGGGRHAGDDIRAAVQLRPVRWALIMLALQVASCGSSETAPRAAPASATEPTSVSEREPEPTSVSEREPEPEPAREPEPAWTFETTLANAAFDTPGSPSVVVHAPATFDPASPLNLVVFVHGWSGCARQLALAGEISCRDGAREVAGWDLAGRFDEAGLDALFVVPQLAFLRRDGSPGRFFEQGRFRAFLEELLHALVERIGPPTTIARVASITLLAHSAGYETALAILRRGGVDAQVRRVALFDALYRGHGPFADWVRASPDRRLVSIHTGQGRTQSQSRLLAGRLREVLGEQLSNEAEGELPALVRAHRVVIARTDVPHGEVPAAHIPSLLPALLDGL